MHVRIFLSFLFYFVVHSGYSQCYKLNSPEAECVGVADNGDVTVRVSPGTMGPNAKAEFIDRIELEYSLDGSFFNAVTSINVGNKWNFPMKLTHVNANANIQPIYYRLVAYCDTLTNYALPNSEMVSSILLTHMINAQNHVELSWNYDGVSTNMLMIVNRKTRSATHWDSIKTMPMIIGPMTFTDTTINESDTFSYQIDFINLDNFCQGSSNVISFIYKKEDVPSSIEEFNDDKIKLWPNPANDALNLSLTGVSTNDIGIDLYSSSGTLIETFYFNDGQNFTINLPNNLPKGLYFIKVQSEGGILTKSFIKD